MSETIDEARLDQQIHKVIGDVAGAMSLFMAYLGDQAGVFAAMDGAGPLSCAALAEKTGLNPKYLHEWLGSVSAAGYVTLHPDETFELTPEQALVFTREGQPACLQGFIQIVFSQFELLDKAVETFKSGKGRAWSEHSQCCFCGTDRFFRPGYAANLVDNWIPALGGVEAEEAAEELEILGDAEVCVKVAAETLRHVGDARLEGGAAPAVGDVGAEDADAALLDALGGGDQAEQGRFADAVRADHRDAGAGGDVEGGVLQRHRPAIAVPQAGQRDGGSHDLPPAGVSPLPPGERVRVRERRGVDWMAEGAPFSAKSRCASPSPRPSPRGGEGDMGGGEEASRVSFDSSQSGHTALSSSFT